MNLTNSQKRKILNDAPMGADVVVLSAKGLRVIEYVQEGRGVVSEWSDIVLSLKMLQKEVDAEDKMMAIVEAVDYYRGGDCDWICGEWAYMYNASENGFFRTGSILEHRELVCTIEEFNQCTKELTGCTKKHAAWLTALNDIRDHKDEQISFSKSEMREIVENAPKWATLYRFGESCGHQYVRDYKYANPELQYINVNELKEQVNRDDLAIEKLDLKWPKARLEKKIKNQRGEINRLNGIIAKLKCRPKKVINIDYEYDSGMRNAMGKIARLIGRSFCVDVGYEDLPDLIEARLVMFRCENKELKMQLGRKKAEIKRLHDEANESKGEWQNGDKCIITDKGYKLREAQADFFNKECTVMSVFYTPTDIQCATVYCNSDLGCEVFVIDMLVKPEKAEQKAGFIADEKATELCKARCDAFGYSFDWDALPEEKKQGYRNMIKAGVVVKQGE